MNTTYLKPSSTRLLSLFLVLIFIFTLGISAGAEGTSDSEVYLGGFPFGLKMDTEGVFIAEISEVDSTIGRVSPAKDADLRRGDVILSVNGKSVDTVDDTARFISDSNGKRLTLEIKRDGKKLTKNLIPVLTKDKTGYKSGLWIKDETAGIGTVTYVEADGESFGGLGHGICDRTTLELLPLKSGTVHSANIDSIEKGTKERPGELKGTLESEPSGELLKNTEAGVFGRFYEKASGLQKISLGGKDEVKVGKCTVYTCLGGQKAIPLEAEITRIVDKTSDTKNFFVRITNKNALEKAGGIVQGMSGSPIVQNGKLVGAVTHVLMRDQQEGYGIFIENMLKAK